MVKSRGYRKQIDNQPEPTIDFGASSARRSVFEDSTILWALGASVCVVYLLSTVTIGFVKSADIPNDYLSFWSAGELALNGQADGVYDRAIHHHQSEVITGARPLDSLPFLMPPTFLFVSIAFAFLGHLPGMALLTAVGVVAVAWPVWRISQNKLAVLLAIAAPTTLVNTQLGQLGMIFTGAATVALLDCRRYPWRSGVALAVLSLKPQLGVGIGLALVAARAWKALFAGVFSSLVIVALSAVIFGSSRWIEFVASLAELGPLVDLAGLGNQGMHALLVSQGAPVSVAGAAQVTLSAAVGIPVLISVRRRGLTGIVMAMVLCMSPLISPRSYVYDYGLLVPAAVLLVECRGELGRRDQVTRATILGCVVLGLLALFGLPTMPLAALALLCLANPFSELSNSNVSRLRHRDMRTSV